jgi:hypothetical protein
LNAAGAFDLPNYTSAGRNCGFFKEKSPLNPAERIRQNSITNVLIVIFKARSW